MHRPLGKQKVRSIDKFDFAAESQTYGVFLHYVQDGDEFCNINRITSFEGQSSSCGKDVYLGKFLIEDKDLSVASFFHEVGHVRADSESNGRQRNSIEESAIAEEKAWTFAIEEMQNRGIQINTKITIFMKMRIMAHVMNLMSKRIDYLTAQETVLRTKISELEDRIVVLQAK